MQKSKDHIRHFLLSEYQLGHNASGTAQNTYRTMRKDAILIMIFL